MVEEEEEEEMEDGAHGGAEMPMEGEAMGDGGEDEEGGDEEEMEDDGQANGSVWRKMGAGGGLGVCFPGF